MSKANNRAAADTFLAVALGLCLPHKDDGEWMRSGAVQEVCENSGIKNLQYKPTRAFADNIESVN